MPDWLRSLSAEAQRRVVAVLLRLRAASDARYAACQRLSPGLGERAGGPQHVVAGIEAESLAALSRGVERGLHPSTALADALKVGPPLAQNWNRTRLRLQDHSTIYDGDDPCCAHARIELETWRDRITAAAKKEPEEST